ncbi:MAG: glycosyltransferase family 4 protein [Candidatus Moranbacteria bacterium]|nr:glycosyltransferase family 4 protein [Candidatus Moranbacteria bacterium]
MRIGIDIRLLSHNRRTGVEEYTIALLREIFEQDKKNEYILLWNAWRGEEPDLTWIEKYPNVSVKKLHIPNKLLNLLMWYTKWPKIDQLINGADIFFLPNMNFASVSRKCRLVMTVHDLSFEHIPEAFSWKRRLWHMFVNPKDLCKRARKIIAVSNASKEDLCEQYNTSRDRVEVVHSGVSKRFVPVDRNNLKLVAVKEKYKLPYKFIFFLGTIEPRKNIDALIRGYAYMQRMNPELREYKLVIAGAKGWLSDDIEKKIKKTKSKNKILFLGEVEEEDKPALYSLASLFVYPSIFEGFGFPPLEAMRCATPVITANTTSLPEIVGNAAVLIDPDKPDEIAQAMKEVLFDRQLATELIYRGLHQSAKFTWEKTAQETIKIFKDMEKK